MVVAERDDTIKQLRAEMSNKDNIICDLWDKEEAAIQARIRMRGFEDQLDSKFNEVFSFLQNLNMQMDKLQNSREI